MKAPPLAHSICNRLTRTVLIATVALAIAPASAGAAFGFLPGEDGFSVSMTNEDGSPATLAGSHPYELHLNFGFAGPGSFTDGDLRDIHVDLPSGMLITPTVRECTLTEFAKPRVSPYQESLSGESCADQSQVGTVAVRSSQGGSTTTRWFGVFNLAHPPGAPQALGFVPFGIPVVARIGIDENSGSLNLDIHNLSQALNVRGLEINLWGMPWAASSGHTWTFWHDNERGNCLNEENPDEPFGVPAQPVPDSGPPPYFLPGTCTVQNGDPRFYVPPSYLTLPTSCGETPSWGATARSWSGESVEAGAPGPSISQCVPPRSVAEVELYTREAAAATGLIFNIHSPDEAPLAAKVRLTSPPKTASMALPDGLTINPSLGAGLGYCTESDFADEEMQGAPGGGCPDTAKIGTVSVDGLLGMPQPSIKGSVYLAKPHENPFGSLIAVYVVIRDVDRGIFFRLIGQIEPDPRTGRLRVTFEGLPQLEYSRFTLTLREGQRSTLVSPPQCGAFVGELDLTPYSEPATKVQNLSFFPIEKGEGGGPCLSGGLAPFSPKLEAGSLNPFAGAVSSFYLHMTRADSEQEITSYSATFPPGFLGKIAGIPFCPDSAIEAARQRTGAEELESPSCPAQSSIGRTLAGYGVGGTLAYAPGKLYLSGPYHGSPISITAIDSAIVGPFDLGVVVVRSAIRVNRQSAQVSIDSAGSDPIPHVLDGIPIHLRDIRVYVDRPDFTRNGTSCDETATFSQLTGAGSDLYGAADDISATSRDRYQLVGCGELDFAPRFGLELRGKTRRGSFPSLRAVYRPRPGNANIKKATVTLPHSEFLAQGHIREICALRLFDAGKCPPQSIYGDARAFTPLLAKPLEGPVYLRSSPTHPLPDLVVSLRGLDGGLAIDLVGRIDSAKNNGMRVRFNDLPDAPVSKFVLSLQGGQRGLLENSANTCTRAGAAGVRFISHNNRGQLSGVKLSANCKSKTGRSGGRER